MRVIERKRYRLHRAGPLDPKGFLLHPDGSPRTVVRVLKRVLGVQFLFIDIRNVRAVVSCRPGDAIIETVQKKWASEPADSTRIQLAWRDQVSLIVLKSVRPRH